MRDLLDLDKDHSYPASIDFDLGKRFIIMTCVFHRL
jgi:hypothetical protein